jgi:hypothetical protein
MNDGNGEMSTDHLVIPCERWALLLAAQPTDLKPADRAALDRHVASCHACAAVRAEYRRMDGLILHLPPPAQLADFPLEVVALPHQFLEMEGGHLVSEDMSPQGHIHSERLSTSMHSASRPPALPSPARRRRSTAWLGASMAAIIVVAFTLVFLAYSRGGAGTGSSRRFSSTPAATPGYSATPLPLQDEQAAYLAGDGHLHEVSLDGAHDITGLQLPMTDFIRQTNAGWVDAAASPSGAAIAYVTATDLTKGGDGIAITSVASSKFVHASVPATDIFWSPDGSQLAADAYATAAMGPVYLINPTTGAVKTIHATEGGQSAYVYRIVGWLDSSHLAVVSGQSAGIADRAAPPSGQSANTGTLNELSGGPALELAVLDVGTGALRHLVDVTTPPDIFVSPDGKTIFVAPSTWVPTGYLVDPTTGQIRMLPKISETFSSRFVNIDNAGFAKGGNWAATAAWQPGSHTIALSLGAWGPASEGLPSPGHQPAGIWLLDLDHDTATQVSRNTYPLAWTSNGRSLLMSDLPASNLLLGGLSVGPTLSTLSIATSGGSSAPLAHHMAVFFGLVRHA